MRVEIKSEKTAVRSGTTDDNRKWSVEEQQGYAYTVDRDGEAKPFPEAVTIRLPDGAKPYPVGMYELDERSFYVGQYGRLTLGTPVLRPVAAAARKTA